MISYIEEDDLLRFMIKEEVDLVLPLIDGGETGKITRNAFTDWVVTFLKHFIKININIFYHACIC